MLVLAYSISLSAKRVMLAAPGIRRRAIDTHQAKLERQRNRQRRNKRSWRWQIGESGGHQINKTQHRVAAVSSAYVAAALLICSICRRRIIKY